MIRNGQDFAFAIFLVAFGAAGLALGWALPVGSASRMGPGYAPTALCGLLIVFGLVIGARALRVAGRELRGFAWKESAFVVGAIALFGLGVTQLGLALSVFATCILLGFVGHDRASAGEGLVFSIALALACAILFGFVLKIGLPLGPLSMTIPLDPVYS